MLDLQNISELPIQFDTDTGKFVLDDSLICGNDNEIKLSEIIPILLNKYLKYPEIIYTRKSNIYKKNENAKAAISYDLISLPPGLLGIEFNKTHIYYSNEVKGKYAAAIQILNGDMYAVIQKNKPHEDQFQMDTFVDDFMILSLKKGNKLLIPSGYYYKFINTGNSPLIFSKVSTGKTHILNYEILRREKGLACYVISKNAKVETVANPKYKIPAKLKPVTLLTYVDKKATDENVINTFKSKKSLYNLVQDIKKILI